MIEFTDDQKKAIAAAQEKFTDLKDKVDSLSDDQLNLLFGEARSMNGWQDKDVSDDTLNQLYSLTKMGPTSTNCCPARFIFIKSDEQKELIKEALLPNKQVLGGGRAWHGAGGWRDLEIDDDKRQTTDRQRKKWRPS